MVKKTRRVMGRKERRGRKQGKGEEVKGKEEGGREWGRGYRRREGERGSNQYIHILILPPALPSSDMPTTPTL